MGVAELIAELEEARRDLIALMETLKTEDLQKVGQHPTEGASTVLGVLRTLQKHERDHIVEMGQVADKLVRART